MQPEASIPGGRAARAQAACPPNPPTRSGQKGPQGPNPFSYFDLRSLGVSLEEELPFP